MHKHLLAVCMLISAPCFSSYSLNKASLNKALFSCIYRTNAWLDPETRSGPGSRIDQTQAIRNALPIIIETLGITSLLDAGCGDFNWMKETDLSKLKHYIGIDIVPDIIQNNSSQFKTSSCTFQELDLVHSPLPTCDAILCRDCLQHLSYEDIHSFISQVKISGAKYLIASTYPYLTTNNDLSTQEQLHLWRYRPLNMQCAPFHFPEPLILIHEESTLSDNEDVRNRNIGIWLVDELPNF